MNQDFFLQSKVAAITGAAGGLGTGIAKRLAGLGASVALLEPGIERLVSLASELTDSGATVLNVACNVTDAASTRYAAAQVLSSFGRIDVLVNNAGVLARPSALESISLEDWDRSLAVNLTGALLCTASFGAAMLEAGAGSIVNIASIAAYSPNTSVAYSVSKAGLLALTRHTAVEWAPRGIRANSVSPGFIRTPLSEVHYANPDLLQLRTQATPVRRLGTVDDVAAIVGFLASPASAFINGEDIVADGGFLNTALMHVHDPAQQYGGTHQADLSAFARLGR
ncbi:short chain dehydrogenase family protein [Paraburkholderia xenovorans LB400]|uniref:Dehydrogenase n=1 Tax=Paraburkholderia xenovorans (strain LB400) TaxID=266265 RepID=Q143V4_PARXL|nr:SDR family NAD(P)-dependent oxidoreductase [Paraburkholderia xenovorans]ABE29385.1 Putative dehydrogenase [Paraburkholderia xenovorans LB400]AIP33765.1 short chain dehydrogenase family protein [Paraburkholderia xenovorans LB400]